MTSELKPVFHIEEFVSGGPKNYAYGIVDPVTGNRETVYKVRGITLSYSASQTVNFEVIKTLVLGGDDSEKVTVHTERKIKRKRADVGYIYLQSPKTRFIESRSLRDGASVTIHPFHSDILKGVFGGPQGQSYVRISGLNIPSHAS